MKTLTIVFVEQILHHESLNIMCQFQISGSPKLILHKTISGSELSFFVVASISGQCTQGIESVTTQPLCADTQVTFACTVNGSNATIWTGSFFLCPDGYNESLLLHSEPNVTECGPFTAQIDESQSQGECYVSTLNFNASLDLNGAVFECYNGDMEEMGNITLVIAGMYGKGVPF